MSYGYNPYSILGKSALTTPLATGETVNFFDQENIETISHGATNMLLKEFKNPVFFSAEDIVKVMGRIAEEKYESIPKMNRRVIMDLTKDYRIHAYSVLKQLHLDEGYIASQNPAYDEVANMTKFDQRLVQKISQSRASSSNATLQFYFT